VALVCLLAAALLVPVPHKVGCDCSVEPVVRRFVAAPYDGTLERALVAPGDVVSPADILARMDGREIRWELASLEAERAKAAKLRDAALAAQNGSQLQQAKLEMERLDLQIGLLEHRADNLEIKAPVAGVVLTGDLEKAEGAPLSIGQTLFEIAPLDRVVIEVAIPEDEIAYVREAMQVDVRLEAYPRRRWQGQIHRIHPSAETREHETVFIAEITLANEDGLLRPGMAGRAKVRVSRRMLGWVLFHKAWDDLAVRVGW
jgi:multidrug efflux pump subunit AcrA (membrane-fusion protein)